MYRSINIRMLTAALLPVVGVVVTIVAFLWSGRVSDIGQDHTVRARLLLRQTALASEYGLFSANTPSLQGVVNAVQQEADVRSVAVFDRLGKPLAVAGQQGYAGMADVSQGPFVQAMGQRGIDVLTQAVTAQQVQVDDFYGAADARATPRSGPVLGFVVLEIGRDAVQSRERQAMWLALGVGGLGVLLGGVFALRLGKRVVDPILRVSANIQRIGRGDFSAVPLDPHDPLLYVQRELNDMALRLAWGRDELEQQVAQATQEIRQKKEEAETATLAKSRFLAAASHDLRQPAHAMGMFIARLNQLPLDASTRELATGLDASVRAMQMLLDGLLDISRLESGTVRPAVRSTELSTLLQTVQQAFEAQAHAQGLVLRVAPTALCAMTDPALLHRMVANLVHNAITYTPQGAILISCRPTGGGQQVRIDVSDSGVGIAPEYQEAIFNEFYQVANPGRDRGKGMGLGLNIVERSARLLGHQIDVRSHPGCGSRFSITLPRSAPAAPRATEVPTDLGADNFDGLRVLVIEDDPLARSAIHMVLVSWGCVVHAVPVVPTAQDFEGNAFAPDFIVSDYRLGQGCSGVEAIAQVRALLGRQIPACLITGDTDTELMRQTQDSGLTLLHKPVRPAKLRSLIRRLTRVPQALEPR